MRHLLLVTALLLCPWSVCWAQANSGQVRISVFRTGVNLYDRGEWAVVGVRGVNSGETDATATVLLYFENDTQTQYKRRFWIPARTTRITWMPVRTPRVDMRRKSIEVRTLNIVETDGEESTLQRGTDPSLFTMSLLPLSNLKTQTAGVHQRRDPLNPTAETWAEDVVDLVTLMRQSAEAEQNQINLGDVFFPPYAHSYDGLDNLVISDSRWLNDSAAPTAFRSWVHRGGKVWVMLNLVGQQTLEALLGSDNCCQIVDRVELNDFTLETPRLAQREMETQERWEAERPVEFVRVLVTGDVTVHSRIGEWPAAFSVKQGNGEVLVTTLGARGWHHKMDVLEDTPSEGVPTQGSTEALGEIGERLLLEKSPETELPTESIQPILQAQIGYEVPSRNTAGFVLGANCLLLLVGGVVLARRNKLEHLVWLLPLCVGLTATVMVVLGQLNVSQVPPTVASVQLLELSSGSDQAQATTYASFYSPTGEQFPLYTDAGGLVAPDENAEGSLSRIGWDGAQNSQWEDFFVAPGAARFVKIRNNYVLRKSVRAVAQFGPEGLVGQITNIDVVGEPSDAMIGAPISADSAVEVDDSGAFVCHVGQQLSPGEYLAGALLSDEQQRRQEIYRTLFGGDVPYPARPTLFIWGDAEPISVAVPEAFESRGATLWAIPLRLKQTPPGSPFVVPAMFTRMQYSRETLGASNVYDPRTGKWLGEATTATHSMFEFVLPPQILPAELDSATVELKITAPSREVQILARNAKTGEIVAVGDPIDSPYGVQRIEIDDADLLRVSGDGALELGISVSDVQGALQGVAEDGLETWQAEFMQVSVSGKTL